MRFKSPKGDEIVGVRVSTPGTVNVLDIDPVTGEYEGDGTEHHYDDQVEVRRSGSLVYVCDANKEWAFKDLVPQLEPESEEA